MRIKDLSLPDDPDSRKIVAAMLTAAVCSLRIAPDKAEPYVCAMYQRFLNNTDAGTENKAMTDWTTLSDELF